MKKIVIGGIAATLLAGAAAAQDTTAVPPPATPDASAPAAAPDATAPATTDATTAAPADTAVPPPPPPSDSMSGTTAATAATSSTTTDGVSWSGLYAGVHGGYGIDNDRPVQDRGVTANNNFALTNRIRPTELRVNRRGFFGGGQVGYNLQSGNLVYGVEADFSYTDIGGLKDYRSQFAFPGFPVGRRLRVSQDTDWIGTVRARAGYGLGSGLIYATGGYAYGKVKGYATFYGDNDAQVNYFGRHNYIAQGWTAGGGFEFKPFPYQDGPMSKISLRGEMLYYDLGKSHIYALQTGAQPGYYTLTTTTRGFNGRVGINYAF